MSSDPVDSIEEQSGGTVVGESIPTPMLTGMVAGLIFAILMMICHITITKCLVSQRLKHLPRARKVKVKKNKKDKKGKGKKGKKGKKGSGTTGTTSGSTSGTTAGGTTAGSTIM